MKRWLWHGIKRRELWLEGKAVVLVRRGGVGWGMTVSLGVAYLWGEGPTARCVRLAVLQRRNCSIYVYRGEGAPGSTYRSHSGTPRTRNGWLRDWPTWQIMPALTQARVRIRYG